MDTIIGWFSSLGVWAALGMFVLLAAGVRLARGAWVVAQPDEWLLRVRNGKVVDGGVGIATWRLPGDVIARFSSAMQRVRFTLDAFTSEHLGVTVEGFILWSVSPDINEAFRAFSKLGIANLERSAHGLRSRAHLLTTAQHHAFQVLLAAEVRAHVATLPLQELLTQRFKLLDGLEARLETLAETLGITIERTEILQVLPTDKDLLKDLAARSEESVREEAASARLESLARQRRKQADDALHLAAEDGEIRLARVQSDRRVAEREQEMALERDLAAEANALRVQAARQKRDEVELAATLDRQRRIAEADRDAAMTRLAAEEQKSPAVRGDERARFVAEQVARAMAAWRIREGKWIQVGDGSPAEAVAKVIVGMQALVGNGQT